MKGAGSGAGPDQNRIEGSSPNDEDAESKRVAIRSMFNRVSSRYDLLNRVLSFGMDGSWRRSAVKAMALQRGDRALDVACGTGDLALEATRSLGDGVVVGIDFAQAMLEIGRGKSKEQKKGGGAVQFITAAAEKLPFADDVFAASAIAFGIRNVPDRRSAIAEMARTVKPGGRVVVLELTTSSRGLMAWLVTAYTRAVLPIIGGTLSRGEAYRYLSTSMDSFPEPGDFIREMEGAGLCEVIAKQMILSPAWVFSGKVPPRSVGR